MLKRREGKRERKKRSRPRTSPALWGHSFSTEQWVLTLDKLNIAPPIKRLNRKSPDAELS